MGNGGIVVLMYHGVGNPADTTEGARYTVTISEFSRHLEEIETRGLVVLNPDTVSRGARGLVVTFDDGEASVVKEALPRLEQRGMRGALFMTTGWIGRPGYLDDAALRELDSAGWLVGSHGHTHRFLSTLAPNELSDELRRSRDRLGEVLGHPPRHLAFPGGRTSSQVFATARSLGFSSFWSSRPGINRTLAKAKPIRRTAIRRGEANERFCRLIEADPLTHALDEATSFGRYGLRLALGDNRYHALTGRVLATLGRR